MTPPGQQLGRFVLLERLGEGGMGEVFRARDPQLGRDVAVKVVRGATDERRRRFVREQQAAARVRHPGIVSVHDAGETGGVGWLAMDLVEGQPLDARLARGALEPREAVRLVAACARAVEALHAAGVLHRDLKPANILLDRAGDPRLTDFGVAALAGAEALTRTGHVMGTPLYMAPEQLTGGEVDERADVFALGAILYEALAGHPPWTVEGLVALTVAKLTLPAPPSRARRASGSGSGGLDPLERRVDELVLRALAPEAAGRPTAGELGSALERALAGEPEARGRGGLVVLALLLLLLAANGAAAWLRPPPPETRRETPAELLARLEQGARRGLATLPSALLADTSAASSAAAPADGAALRAWVGLAALAAGDADRAAALATEPAPAGCLPAIALRGALAALRDDPAAALVDLDAARPLRLRELEGWRARAQARRGVERAEAGPLLERVASLRTGPDPESADLLEVACLVGLGRRADAALALARVKDPPAELRWELALLAAHDALAAGRPGEAWQAVRDAPARPPWPPSRREEGLCQLALDAMRVRVEGVQGRTTGEEVVACVSLRTRLASSSSAPAPLARDLVLLGQTSVIAGLPLRTLDLLLGVSEVWEDAASQRLVADHLVALLFTDSRFLTPEGAELEGRLERAGQRALSASGADPIMAGAGQLLLSVSRMHLGRPAEAVAALDALEVALRGGTASEELRLVGASSSVLRAWLARARGDHDVALRLIDEAAARGANRPVVTYVRLMTLRDAGRLDALAACAREHVREDPHIGWTDVGPPLRQLVWTTLTGRGEWADLATWYARYLDRGGQPFEQVVARAVVASARAGRADEAARLARQWRALLPEGLAEGIARGDAAALDSAARIAGR